MTRCRSKLTVQPLWIVFQRPFESVFATARSVIVEIGAEDDGVGFGELGVGAGIEGGQIARIASLNPDGRRIVAGVKRALGDAHADTGDVLVATQMSQVGLDEKKHKRVTCLSIRKRFGLFISKKKEEKPEKERTE